ncbi:MAG: hypothetical protein ACKPA7_14895, partial [Sphaerospermopsis kisseleviana]
RRVRKDAQNRCGYCLSPQRLVMARLEISCCAFNLYKWNRQEACSTRVQNIRIIQFSGVTAYNILFP